MKKNNILNNIELRSESVQEILTRPPHWMIRWGNSWILLILFLVLLMSYFIRYPEFIPASIIVTSANTPEKISTNNNSKIERVLIKNHQRIKKDDLLIILKSSGNYDDILRLKEIMDSIPINKLLEFPFGEVSKFNLGELQNDFDHFAKSFTTESYSPSASYYSENMIENIKISEVLNRQKKLGIAKSELHKKIYQNSRKLFNEEKISLTDLESEQLKYLEAQQNLESVQLSLALLDGNMHNKTRYRADKTDGSTLHLHAYEELKKSLKLWEHKNLIISATDGMVSFQKPLEKNESIISGDTIISIFPYPIKSLIGKLKIPANSMGKINTGQKVLIKLNDYNYQEYGVITGKVERISNIGDENGNYSVEVALPKKLVTSHKKIIKFEKELKGSAEIVTKDVRLIERFMSQIKTVL